MDLGLKDKIAVVTGSSRGIGKGIALALAKEGCHVVCVATTEEGAKGVAAEIAALGVKSMAIGCDVADFSAVEKLAQAVTSAFEGCDILVNNAGITRDQLLLRMKEDDWDRVIDVNLKGVFNCSKHFAKSLMRRSGRIINLTSVVGITGNAGQANYAASKGGVIAFTKSMAKELASREVCVNAVAPGFIETDMTEKIPPADRQKLMESIPLRRLGSTDDIAAMTVFLASRAASYITGQVFTVDGGLAV